MHCVSVLWVGGSTQTLSAPVSRDPGMGQRQGPCAHLVFHNSEEHLRFGSSGGGHSLNTLQRTEESSLLTDCQEKGEGGWSNRHELVGMALPSPCSFLPPGPSTASSLDFITGIRIGA